MTPEFFAIVKEMREAQKKYFKTRMSYDLEHAKKLEREVDAAIERAIGDEKGLMKQKNLWE